VFAECLVLCNTKVCFLRLAIVEKIILSNKILKRYFKNKFLSWFFTWLKDITDFSFEIIQTKFREQENSGF